MNTTTVTEPSAAEIKRTKLYATWGLSADEYDLVCQQLGRLPNFTETGLFAVMWSEHCSYKNSKTVLKQFPTTGPRVLRGPGEGAGVVDIGDGQAVVFKAESHNHPSAVEPYEGAATGVGGIIRDIFSMGAQPIAILDSLHFGDIADAHTKYLVNEVVRGIAAYGNCIGIPTVGGETNFDQAYAGNPLVNAMCVGLLDQQQVQVGQAKGAGNLIVYVGATTGRDGIHGATFASEEFATETESDRSAVQVGDPFTEKLVMDACLAVVKDHADALIGMQDMGAAGLVSSSAEMAAKAGTGMTLNLDKVPTREPNMTAYEMMLSESQERMLLCVRRDAIDDILGVFAAHQVRAVTIGEVTTDGQYRLHHRGQIVADVPVEALVDGVPMYQQPQRRPDRLINAPAGQFVPVVTDIEQMTYQLLAQPTIASKQAIYETYDSQVKTNTVVTPGGDAAVLRLHGTKKALALTMDGNGRATYLDPQYGGALTVAEAASNIVASGGQPLALTDCLNFGNPMKADHFYDLAEATKGMAVACRQFQTPVISGNVSLYNETNGQAIYPTPVVGMVGLIDSLEHVTTPTFKHGGDLIYVVGATSDDFNGSELQKLMLGKVEGQLVNHTLSSIQDRQAQVLAAIKAGFIASAHDISAGGLMVALLESSFAGSVEWGMTINWHQPLSWLFAETPGRFVVSVKTTNQAAFEALVPDAIRLGQVMPTPEMVIRAAPAEVIINVRKAKAIYEGSLSWALK